jgi:Mn2+/Fe2+ NRAMP family transporter
MSAPLSGAFIRLTVARRSAARQCWGRPPRPPADYVWQTIGQAEEKISKPLHQARQIDALLGSLFAVAILWFILVATGATLGVHQQRADTAEQAAEALRPVAGDLFAFGLLASAVVALPVIMATTAYVTGAHLKWRRGLSLRIREAPLFYGALAAAALLGTVVTFTDIPPIRLLFIAGIWGSGLPFWSSRLSNPMIRMLVAPFLDFGESPPSAVDVVNPLVKSW